MNCNGTPHKGAFRIGIVGLGLVGGSIGLALKGVGYPATVAGYDIDPEAVRLAIERHAIDTAMSSVEGLSRESDMLILAVPVAEIQRMSPILRRCVRGGTVVTDVGSAKVEICRTMETTLPDGVEFVGGHPMAGSECSGIRAATPHLFRGASYVLTRTTRTSDLALSKVKELVSSLGATPIVMSPEEHDKAVALTSHLAYLIACGLVRSVMTVSGQEPLTKRLVAGAFRDMTRVASGDPLMSMQMCLANREMIKLAYGTFMENMEGLLEMLYSGDVRLKSELERIKEFRDCIKMVGDDRGIS